MTVDAVNGPGMTVAVGKGSRKTAPPVSPAKGRS